MLCPWHQGYKKAWLDYASRSFRPKKNPRLICDMKHHYRYSWYWGMWMHTGKAHFVRKD